MSIVYTQFRKGGGGTTPKHPYFKEQLEFTLKTIDSKNPVKMSVVLDEPKWLASPNDCLIKM